MATVQKLSEKLTIHVNRTGFYLLISVFVTPFLVHPFLKFDKLKNEENHSNCTQLNSRLIEPKFVETKTVDSQVAECDIKLNGLKEEKNNSKHLKWGRVIRKAEDNKSEIAQLSSFNYPIQGGSETKELKFDELPKFQAEIEKVGRYINFLLTDSEESSSDNISNENTQIDHLSHEVNSGKLRIFIFYGFFIIFISSVLESNPFYEKLIFDRKSRNLTVLKFMIFWFKRKKYSLGNNFNFSIESESDDYDTSSHRLNLVLESKEKIVLYRNSDYDKVEKMLQEIRDFLNLDHIKVEKIKV